MEVIISSGERIISESVSRKHLAPHSSISFTVEARLAGDQADSLSSDAMSRQYLFGLCSWMIVAPPTPEVLIPPKYKAGPRPGDLPEIARSESW